MIQRNAQGQVIRVFTYSGPMRAHGGDREMRTDKTLSTLDDIAKRATPCNERGYILRGTRGRGKL